MTASTRDANRAFTVTVILPTYNRARYLPQALDSILAQTRPPDEIIVIDDGSSDETPDTLETYGSAVRVVRQDNAGKPAALNHALRLAETSHIWIFDDDDLALPGALAGHVTFLESNPDIDFSYSDNYTFDGDGDIEDEKRWRRPLLATAASPDTLLLALMRRCTLVFQGLLVPARCFRAVGGFDESLGRAEDYDMLLKLARRFRGGASGHWSFVWRNHAGERGSANERHAHAERNIVFRRYERRIFAALYADLALSEYLPNTPARRTLSARAATQALIERCDIMFRHDLNAQAGNDLKALLNRPALDDAAVEAIEKTVARACNIDDRVFVASSAAVRARVLADAIGGAHRRRLRRAARRGFYWSARRALGQRAWRDLARLGAALSLFNARALRAGHGAA